MKLLATNNTLSPVLMSLVVLIAILAAFTMYLIYKASRIGTNSGAVPEMKRANYAFVFFIMISAASMVAYMVKLGVENSIPILGLFLFSVFPYLALLIFIIGSIYRYTSRGYQVSSLSSEFLERGKLFWGSQLFHWGILILFFGHLIAFLFPRAVLAWNGEPVRLLILEITSFAFGLAALLGIILLVSRRLSNKRLLMVSNKMDMLVYTVLLVQIISGLSVAYFSRWGSSWFAGVLTPYLRSVFAFNPDIAAVSSMPWIIQLHIFSAFFIVAIIPFTRFMHFLVAPLDYIWRGYQLVVWNWSRKAIRKSSIYFFGRKSENN